MKTKFLSIGFLVIVALVVASCKKIDEGDDKNKIDIKGSLSNGDMRSPNLVATFAEKTLCVTFYDDLGDCTINISNRDHSVALCDTVKTYYYATYLYDFHDQPLNRYHLVISNGTDEAEGWFNNFRIVVHHTQR